MGSGDGVELDPGLSKDEAKPEAPQGTRELLPHIDYAERAGLKQLTNGREDPPGGRIRPNRKPPKPSPTPAKHSPNSWRPERSAARNHGSNPGEARRPG